MVLLALAAVVLGLFASIEINEAPGDVGPGKARDCFFPCSEDLLTYVSAHLCYSVVRGS